MAEQIGQQVVQELSEEATAVEGSENEDYESEKENADINQKPTK